MDESKSQEIFEQIVSTWRFLHVGLALDAMMRDKPITDWKDFETFGHPFKGKLIEDVCPADFSGEYKESYFGSQVFYLSARKITSCIVEGIDSDDKILTFADFLKQKLGDQFEAYNSLVRFCSNVLSHNVTGRLILKLSDFEGLLKEVELNIDYSKIWDAKYAVQDSFLIKVDFEKVVDEKSLFNFITPKEIMKIVILSGCLTQSYIDERLKDFIENSF